MCCNSLFFAYVIVLYIIQQAVDSVFAVTALFRTAKIIFPAKMFVSIYKLGSSCKYIFVVSSISTQREHVMHSGGSRLGIWGFIPSQ